MISIVDFIDPAIEHAKQRPFARCSVEDHRVNLNDCIVLLNEANKTLNDIDSNHSPESNNRDA